MDLNLLFKAEEALNTGGTEKKAWKVIISDDDYEVHAVTRLALGDFTFEGRPLEFLSAYNGHETLDLMRDNPDTAVLLLDVVMEEEDTGLKVVKGIRNDLNNPFVRIILRTGQPGQAPQIRVIRDFDINDYKEKIELTDQKLYASVTTSLRSYRDLRLIERHSRQIQESLQEKEVLIKEIHHRVKNNLQVITSLLSMQLMRIKDLESLQMFQDSRDRVRTMALIHEKLYQSENFSQVDLGDFIHSLSDELSAYYSETGNVSFDLHIDPVSITIDKAVPCGLIVNEVFTNALKYAFRNRSGGTVRVDLRREEDEVLLAIKDDGEGLPPDLVPETVDTLGMQLISILSDQLEAKMEMDRAGGTGYSLIFSDSAR